MLLLHTRVRLPSNALPRASTCPLVSFYDEHRELLRCVREKDEEGAVAMQRRHLKSLSEFAAAFNDENHFLE